MQHDTFARRLAARWRSILAIATLGIASVYVIPFVVPDGLSAEPARALQRQPSVEERPRQDWEEWRRAFDERMARLDAESEERRLRLEEMAKLPPRPKRKVRRFQWESPAETRGKIWNVPETEADEALLTALLRVCIAEADGRPQDCAGIWQVVRNNRRRSCDRGTIRRITECDENGETYLSAIRRHQRHVLGYMKARNRRAVWIAKLTPDCEMPDGYLQYLRRRDPGTTPTQAQNQWDAGYGAKTCPQAVSDARRLIEGKLPEGRPGARVEWLQGRPVTWGGRCETKGGACDDRMACERVLARIPDTNTLNAFWCRIGNTGCRQDPEPICEQLGYRYEQVQYRGRLVWKLALPGSHDALTKAPSEPTDPET